MNNSMKLKKELLSLIKKLAVEHRQFLVNPDKDFSRYRKFSLESMIQFIICMEAGSIKDEFTELVDQYNGDKVIYIADRGFESFNGFEHVPQTGNFYLIRVKDIHAKTGVTRSFGSFPDGEFDIDVSRLLTRRNTKKIKAHLEVYKFMPKNQRFDYFDEDKDIPYEFHTRIVRFKIREGTYECVITNLD